jgi:hypothetical protein
MQLKQTTSGWGLLLNRFSTDKDWNYYKQEPKKSLSNTGCFILKIYVLCNRSRFNFNIYSVYYLSRLT